MKEVSKKKLKGFSYTYFRANVWGYCKYNRAGSVDEVISNTPDDSTRYYERYSTLTETGGGSNGSGQ